MERTPEGVIDFSQFKKKKEDKEVKPFFQNPTMITLSNGEENIEFMLLVNLVYNGKQILALQESTPGNDGVSIVEAMIEEGAFTGVTAVESDEEYNELVEILRETLDIVEEGEPDEPVH